MYPGLDLPNHYTGSNLVAVFTHEQQQQECVSNIQKENKTLTKKTVYGNNIKMK